MPPSRPRTVLLACALPLVLVVGVWSAVRADAAGEGAAERSRAGASVSATASRSKARAGSKVVVSGKVAGPTRRPVVLETKVDGGWRALASGRTNAKQRYRLRLPTTWYHRHTLRVRAPAVGGAAAGTSRTRAVRVKPSYKPSGSASDFALPYSQGNYRWNACKPIQWRFHKGGGFGGSLKVVRRALLEVTRGTGLTFSYAGTTSKVPLRDDTSGVADLVIG